MIIYEINNLTVELANFVCDSQDTINTGKAAGYNGIFSIGTSSDADAILSQNQSSWLQKQASIFSVSKVVFTSTGNEWIDVNLATEPYSTDADYRLLNVPNGDYIQAIGLDDAKNKEAEIQNNYLIYCGLSSYLTLTEWPVKPLP